MTIYEKYQLSNHIIVENPSGYYQKYDSVFYRETLKGFADYDTKPGEPLSICVGKLYSKNAMPNIGGPYVPGYFIEAGGNYFCVDSGATPQSWDRLCVNTGGGGGGSSGEIVTRDPSTGDFSMGPPFAVGTTYWATVVREQTDILEIVHGENVSL